MNPIDEALKLPNGARFYRCALQVNPYAYLLKNKKPTSFTDEASYNKALVEACRANRIEAIAITDHFNVDSSDQLTKAACDAGIVVFQGFEARTKDGVHLLCLFNPDSEATRLNRIIGDCGVHGQDTGGELAQYDVLDFLDKASQWNAVCVAAHVAANGGLLSVLKGKPRTKAWCSDGLLAVSLPGPVSDERPEIRAIIENTDPEHHRSHPMAVINALDVSSPDDLAKPGSSCWIKMSELSVDGLRQAFLDPGSRVRLASDPVPEAHAEIVAAAWQTEGFLKDAAIHLNENLNVLIGGRGAGKSTVIESIRYALGLDPVGDEARKAHEGIIQHVLRPGTKISVLVRSYRPTRRDYVVERTIPNPPVLKDETGVVLPLSPRDVVPGLEIYGQHEISELAKTKEKRTRLLGRFAVPDTDLLRRRGEVKRELEKSRARISDVLKEQKLVEERLGRLPGLEEMLKRFQEAGLEEKLREQSLLVREERVLKTVAERVVSVKEQMTGLRAALPLDRAFLAEKALADLPGRDVLVKADAILKKLSDGFEDGVRGLTKLVVDAEASLAQVRSEWNVRSKQVQAEYEETLRELQKTKVDGEEFIRLRRQIEELRPLKERQVALAKALQDHDAQRRNQLAEWEDVKREEFQRLERAAKDVSQRLERRVHVQVEFQGDRRPLGDLLRNRVGGRLAEAIDALERFPGLSLKALADAGRRGGAALRSEFGLTQTAADRIASAPPEVIMEVEELDLEPTTMIKLNVNPDGREPAWQTLDELSTGQKATAVLLLLLLESEAPLIVDQPEDDLDNRFITDGVVPKMRDEKRRRQFIFATHNANIPVLGDAELIVGLSAKGDASQGKTRMPSEHMGSIDSRPVRELVEEVLEGGREAFETRRAKYGF
ncbi:MAG: phosphoesterase [candidate division WOR-3 bacterium]|nr:phosphoesterase [candidate division WOR-3 bacterium]